MFYLPVRLFMIVTENSGVRAEFFPAKCSMTPSSRDAAMNSAEGACTTTAFRQTLLLVRSVEDHAPWSHAILTFEGKTYVNPFLIFYRYFDDISYRK